jgi:hypothetical protein
MTKSVVKLALEPLNPSELPKMLDGLRKVRVICGGGYMSYEEEDTCHMVLTRCTPPPQGQQNLPAAVHQGRGERRAPRLGHRRAVPGLRDARSTPHVLRS